MRTELAVTGTSELLEQLSDFIPDDFINELIDRPRRSGRRPHWRPAQLYRLLLLTLLTPAHSTNLMLGLLPEQRAWRKFAHLPNRYRLPVASQLHDFRQALGVGGLRRINERLTRGLLTPLPGRKTVALIDATDLPAATRDSKKNSGAVFLLAVQLWVAERSNRAKAATSWAIKNTPCVCGFSKVPSRFFWFRLSRGQRPPIAARPCFCGPVYGIA